MELYEKIETVKSKEDFIDFVNDLIKDFEMNQNDWENNNLKSFLQAISAWTGDMEGFYQNQKKVLPANIDWNVFANILYASKMYE